MKTAPSRIAIVSGYDDALAPDTTAQLLKRLGVDPGDFYRERAGKLVDEGWDPPLACLVQT